jgi:hypothetical protein
MLMGVRDDALSGQVTADGDNIAARFTNNGEIYIKHVDDINIADGGNVISTDWNGTAPPIGAGTEAAALRVTVATDSTGVLSIDDNGGNLSVDNAGTFVVQVDGAALNALELIDDVIYVDDADWTDSVSKHALVGGLYQSTPQSITDGDVGPLQVDVNGNVIESNSAAILADTANMDTNLGTIAGAVAAGQMQVDIVADGAGLALAANQLADGHNVTVDNASGGSAVNIQDGGNSITVDTTADATDGGAHGASQTGFRAMGTDGTNDQQIAVDATGNVQVDIVADAAGLATSANQLPDGHNVTIDNAAGASAVNIQDGGNIITVDGTVTANAGSGTLATSNAVVDGWDNAASDGASVSGDVAHDTADAGEPVKVGYKAVNFGATPTAVATNDRTDGYATRAGIPFMLGGHPNVITKHLNVTDADGAQTDTALVTVAASTAIVVTHIAVTADNANTGDVQCRIGFGTANTPAVDTDAILSHPGIAAGSGIVVGSGAGIVGIGASNEDLRVTCEDPAGGNLDIVVGYFTIAI